MSNTQPFSDTVPTDAFADAIPTDAFVDRRNAEVPDPPGVERRQFTNSHSNLSSEARELADAIDNYKVCHRRRFITFEEMLAVISELGYKRG